MVDVDEMEIFFSSLTRYSASFFFFFFNIKRKFSFLKTQFVHSVRHYLLISVLISPKKEINIEQDLKPIPFFLLFFEHYNYHSNFIGATWLNLCPLPKEETSQLGLYPNSKSIQLIAGVLCIAFYWYNLHFL